MENNEHRDQLVEGRWAIGAAWYIPSSHRRQFRKDVKRMLLLRLTALHGAKRIAAVLPFHHRPVRVREESSNDAWTDYWVIVLAAHVDPNEVWNSIESSARAAVSLQGKLLRAEVLRPQPTLDMYYPRIGGIAREPTGIGSNMWCRDPSRAMSTTGTSTRFLGQPSGASTRPTLLVGASASSACVS